MPPPSLYKFVTPDRVDILTSGLVRYTQPLALNDPFELQPVFDQLFPQKEIDGFFKPPFDFEIIEQALREQYADLPAAQQAQIPVDDFVELVRNNPELYENEIQKLAPSFSQVISEFAAKGRHMLTEMLQSKLGILSLTESIDHPLLWAHYGADHQGFALEFDSSHGYFDRRLSAADELRHLRKVKYLDRNPIGRTLHDLDGDDLLATKTATWSYEREWRILEPIENENKVIDAGEDKIHLFQLPLDTITGIILGARSKPKLCSGIQDALKLPSLAHIKLSIAVLDMQSQQIKIQGFSDH